MHYHQLPAATNDMPRRGHRRPRLVWLLLAAATLVVALPAGVWAGDAFTDVGEGNVHHDAITAIVDAGVTQGCADGLYCPAEGVRRDQMATFMDRLGALSGQTPVVNAATAQQATAADQAADSARLEGVDGQELLDRIQGLEDGATAPAADGDSDLADRVAALETQLADATGRIDTLEGDLAASNSRVDTLETDLAAAGSRIDTLEGDLATATGRIDTLEGDNAELQATLAGVTRSTVDGHDTLQLEGMNLQLVNGTDSTDGAPNGLGNLIIGYNAPRGGWGSTDPAAERAGSHYLVVGDEHHWTSFGGLLTGLRNTASGDWATVTGGSNNDASGQAASVTGGSGNDASGSRSSVSGGSSNDASGARASVSGGWLNDAIGNSSSASGGQFNDAIGDRASVSGGASNEASGNNASILGGSSNTVSASNGCHPGC